MDLLRVVEQLRKEGTILNSINSTFLNIILKCEKPKSFVEFHLISLCNLIYKIITKIISNRFNPILGRVISKEQFGFLKNRKILEAVGIY